MVTKIAKLLSAGLMGVAVFLLLRSAVFIKLFYPNVSLPAGTELEYQPTLIASVVAGLAGPLLVRRLQAKARRVGA
jgi:H+/Cl- antiporter ClcA